jgi:branched-chain amino acid transport system ATP-binding protein
MPTSDGNPPLLSIEGLKAWYGEAHVLQGIDLALKSGELVTLLGRNGAGKTTTLRAIMGLLARVSGTVRHRGENILGQPPEDIALRGIAYCPEERGIFSSLSVQENLMLPPVLPCAQGVPLEKIFALFPNIQPRLNNPGAKLSGGEQQMLAIARILRTGARVLLLDEPTEGLAPVIIKQIRHVLQALKSENYTILLVEQNTPFAARVADRHYIIENGRIVDSMTNSEFSLRREQVAAYLGV